MISAPRTFELYWEPTRGGRYVHICDCRANWAAIDLRLGPSHGPIQGVKARATSKGAGPVPTMPRPPNAGLAAKAGCGRRDNLLVKRANPQSGRFPTRLFQRGSTVTGTQYVVHAVGGGTLRFLCKQAIEDRGHGERIHICGRQCRAAGDNVRPRFSFPLRRLDRAPGRNWFDPPGAPW